MEIRIKRRVQTIHGRGKGRGKDSGASSYDEGEEEWLRQMYFDEGLDATEVVDGAGRSSNSSLQAMERKSKLKKISPAQLGGGPANITPRPQLYRPEAPMSNKNGNGNNRQFVVCSTARDHAPIDGPAKYGIVFEHK